jgi:hypothetical protein
MKQAFYGLTLYLFLMLPPVVELAESVMVIHMHMQMPLLVIAGMLMTHFFQQKFPSFFNKWNENGVPGILLFLIIFSYWLLPRAMDEALTFPAVEVFKFISLPFLAGVPLRDSWKKIRKGWKNTVFTITSVLFGLMAYLYIFSDSQLCNNYLIVEQITLGWAFLFTAVAILVYFIQSLFIDTSEFESRE